MLGGSTKNLDKSILNLSAKLKEQTEEIERVDESKHVDDVIAFYNDLYTTFNIINKRMASKNSPTNEKGKTVNTMMTENIIVLKKN